ncbi:outer membrane efflux protein [Salinisphaera sp. PC39]|uniref:TolC family protein n=1 Tax=Salinisphaera sp. PC39 TaxID=1304156 RepID=UPI00333E5117
MRFPASALLLALGLSGAVLPAYAGNNALGLDQAVRIAIEQDPWLTGSRQRESALANEAVAAAQLPDPKVNLAARNLPTDTFDLDQEAMTQLSVGISQTLPRGDSRSLARRRKEQLAAQQPLLRADRRARVAASVSRLWLDAFRAQESIRLIESDRVLFEHLVDAAEAKYSAALVRTRQHDVIRAQLELTRLEDRLTALRQQKDVAQQRLSEWIGPVAGGDLDTTLPRIAPAAPDLLTDSRSPSRQTWYEHVRRHPALLAVDRRIDAVRTDVDLARQKYRPEWNITAQYGYRDDEPTGRDRADLFSVGVTFDLPIFTDKRQDRELAAARARAEEAMTDRSLLVRELVAQLDEARDRLVRLDQREAIFNRRLLPQMRQQAEASLTAYYNDDGDFAEAVRAHIDELNAKIEALTVTVERLKTIAQINYLLAQAPSDAQRVSELNRGIAP